MSGPCGQLDAFFDGELAPGDAARFIEHLAACPTCPGELDQLFALAALAHQIPAEVTTAARPAPPRLAVAPPLPTTSPPPRRSRARVAAMTAVAAAAGMLLVLLGRGLLGPEPDPLALAAAGPTRPIAGRLSRGALDHHRPYEPSLSAGAARALPLQALGALERRKDRVGAAELLLLHGAPGQAAALLATAPRDPDVDADRAVAALALGQLEEAVAYTEAALEARGRHPQALWNRALVLGELGLALAAAETFDRVAALGERGWGAEAADRAAALRAAVQARRGGWLAFNQLGRRLVESGQPIPEAEVAAHPGVARHYFYHAVRAAPTRERVLALLPMARRLDALRPATAKAPPGLLADHVTRVAAADFRVRQPLAAAYLKLWQADRPPPRRETDALLAAMRRARQDDILFGAIQLSESPAAQVDLLGTLAAQSPDPWLRLVHASERAKVEIAGGEFAAAEQRLQGSLGRCHDEGLEYRCGYLERQLVEMYYLLNRNSEARRQALLAWDHARASGEWGFESVFVQEIELITEIRHGYPLARAFLEEARQRHNGRCDTDRYLRLREAWMALDQLQLDAARAAASRIPLCDEPPLPEHVHILAVLAHHPIPAPAASPGLAAEALEAQRGLAAYRARPGRSRADEASADTLEGRLLLERDPAAGRALLERALATVERLDPLDLDRIAIRPQAYGLLLVEAARRGAWDEARQRFAGEAGVAAPPRCALGLSADFDRLLVLTVDGDGRASGALREGLAALPPAGEAVTPAMRGALASCPVIDVFARGTFQGTTDLLPPGLAWRYRVGQHPSGAPAPGGARLIVSAPEAPASLALPTLSPWNRWAAAPGESVRLVTGKQATPAGVTAAMGDASEVLFHAHGLVDLRVADASFLALSPDEAGRYALTAGEVRAHPLPRHPIVYLASCLAAVTSPGRIQPWSLPAAFLEAGASAVFASSRELSDAEVRPFFDDLAAAIRRGAEPAVALRDARARAARAGPPGSVESVMLFQ